MPTENQLPKGIRSLAQLTAIMKQRSGEKSAAVAAVSEKDDREKGETAIPKDPQTAPAVTNLPANDTNKDTTKATPPAADAMPQKTIVGEEKPASINAKAAGVVASLTTLRNNMRKAATAAEITPNMPSDKGNDNRNSTPTEPLDKHPAGAAKATPDANAKAAESASAEPMDPTKKDPPTPPKDGKGALPASGENTDKTKEKMANAEPNVLQDIDPAFHLKIASVLLATEEGRRFCQQELERAEGASAAEDIVKAAMFMEQQEAQLMDAQSAGILQAQEFWNSATPEQREQIEKIASVHNQAVDALEYDFEKVAYNQGATDAAQMQDAGMMGGMAGGDQGGAPGGDPSGGMGGGGGMPPGGDPSGGMGGGGAPGGAGGGEVSDEDIAQVLQHMMQSGEIDQQTAMDIMQQLTQGGAGGDPSGGMGGGAGGPPSGMGGGDQGGAPAPGGDGSGGPPGKAAKKKAPKKEADDEGGDDKEASVEGIMKLASAAVEELMAANA